VCKTCERAYFIGYNQEPEKLIVTLREQASAFEKELARLRASGIDTEKGENLLNPLKESIDQKDLKKCDVAPANS